MWGIRDFNKWNNKGRQINKNVIELNIAHSNIKKLGDLGNLINLKKLFCYNNQLTSLEGIENLVKLIKNKKQIKIMKYNFIDSNDYIELNNLFDNLIKCDDNKIVENIEKMIIELNGFQNMF
jgi:Leucine-rich repeat (LRR) protein